MKKTEEKDFNCNEVTIIGTVKEKLKRRPGDDFFDGVIETKRLSGTIDTIAFSISKWLLKQIPIKKGDTVEIKGEFISYNILGPDKKRHRKFRVQVKKVKKVIEGTRHYNEVILRGYMVQKSELRRTEKNRMKVREINVAVDNGNKASYHIPCTLWGKKAVMANEMEVGEPVAIIGRIQTRPKYRAINNIEEACCKENVVKTDHELREHWLVYTVNVFEIV